MRQPKIFHAQFAVHPRPGINTSMTDRIEIYKPTGKQPQWVPGQPMPDGAFELVYRGFGRIQPNLDWRARDRKHAGELDATQAVRVQFPIGGNELGPDVMVAKDYKVVCIEPGADAAPWITKYEFMVRNATQASQKWLFTILCDTGTRIVGG